MRKLCYSHVFVFFSTISWKVNAFNLATLFQIVFIAKIHLAVASKCGYHLIQLSVDVYHFLFKFSYHTLEANTAAWRFQIQQMNNVFIVSKVFAFISPYFYYYYYYNNISLQHQSTIIMEHGLGYLIWNMNIKFILLFNLLYFYIFILFWELIRKKGKKTKLF